MNDKYVELLNYIFTHFDILHPSINIILALNNNDINMHYTNLIIKQFNTYLDLPPYHKKQLIYSNNIPIILEKCVSLVYNEQLYELTHKIIDELVIVIMNIDYNDFALRYFKKIFTIKKIHDAYIMMTTDLIKKLKDEKYVIESNHLQQICESVDDRVRIAGLEKVVNEKEKYLALYNKYYN